MWVSITVHSPRVRKCGLQCTALLELCSCFSSLPFHWLSNTGKSCLSSKKRNKLFKGPIRPTTNPPYRFLTQEEGVWTTSRHRTRPSHRTSRTLECSATIPSLRLQPVFVRTAFKGTKPPLDVIQTSSCQCWRYSSRRPPGRSSRPHCRQRRETRRISNLIQLVTKDQAVLVLVAILVVTPDPAIIGLEFCSRY